MNFPCCFKFWRHKRKFWMYVLTSWKDVPNKLHILKHADDTTATYVGLIHQTTKKVVFSLTLGFMLRHLIYGLICFLFFVYYFCYSMFLYCVSIFSVYYLFEIWFPFFSFIHLILYTNWWTFKYKFSLNYKPNVILDKKFYERRHYGSLLIMFSHFCQVFGLLVAYTSKLLSSITTNNSYSLWPICLAVLAIKLISSHFFGSAKYE